MVQPHPGYRTADPDLAGPVARNGAPSTHSEFDGYVDYTAVGEEKNVLLPDGRQYVTIRPLTEAGRVRYLKASQTSMKVKRGSDEAEIPVGDVAARKELLSAAIVDWNIVERDSRNGQWRHRTFNDSNVRRWLDMVKPSIVDLIEHEVRKQNAWLVEDLTIEDLDEQINRLVELRDEKLRSEADEKNFPSRG